MVIKSLNEFKGNFGILNVDHTFPIFKNWPSVDQDLWASEQAIV